MASLVGAIAEVRRRRNPWRMKPALGLAGGAIVASIALGYFALSQVHVRQPVPAPVAAAPPPKPEVQPVQLAVKPVPVRPESDDEIKPKVRPGVALKIPTLTGQQPPGLPPIKTTAAGNRVPDCATPGRLMAFLHSRNSAIDPRFRFIATEYMLQGETMAVRWDYAFFQMLVETRNLSFKVPGRRADVAPSQNNFASLGATGQGIPGESFRDVATGVRAHLQHVIVYAGDRIDDPVAERTRKIQEWGILASLKKIDGPVTFQHLAERWAPGGEYGSAIQETGNRFYADFCGTSDRSPELLSMPISGVELARRAIADAKSEKGGGIPPRPRLLSRPGHCQVWLARSGAEKAVIIRGTRSGIPSYLALDVRIGRERDDVNAFIEAHGAWGDVVGEFVKASMAVEKAFELCPQ